MNRLKNIDHGFIDIDKLRYVKIIKDNKKDIEDKSNTTPYNSKLLSYINIYNGNRSKIHVTTPEMVCPFGLETKNGNVIKLQFTNYKSDQNMKSFYDFITRLEYIQMKYIGLTEETIDDYISQIKYDKNNKYDPLLVVKVPFTYNKFNVDIYHDKYNLNITNINKFSKVVCDLYIDKIWKYNEKYICKWKLESIYVK
tara:strand:+ start:97 stop:687 length:591 start_codon:yes stop_codon:yes gene_type:complete